MKYLFHFKNQHQHKAHSCEPKARQHGPVAMRHAPCAFESGYTLLFAVLTATLVLGVAVFITSVSRKQFILSETARESTFSLYNADSGMECAAAAFSRGAIASSSANNSLSCDSDGTKNIAAFGAFAPSSAIVGLSNERRSVPASFSFANGGCAIVTFTTGYDSSNNLNTVIDSLGYNVCSGTPLAPASGSRTVERALELTYD